MKRRINDLSSSSVMPRARFRKISPTASSPEMESSTKALPCFAWQMGQLRVDECCCDIILEQQHPVAIFVEENDLDSIVGTMKMLFSPRVPIAAIWLKNRRDQIKSSLIDIQKTKGVIFLHPSLAVVVDQCLPRDVSIKTVVHSGNISLGDLERRNFPSHKCATNHIILFETMRTQKCSLGDYVFRRDWISIIKARVAAARKLYAALCHGRDCYQGQLKMNGLIENRDSILIEDDVRKGLIGHVEALKIKLKVLISVNLPGMVIAVPKNSLLDTFETRVARKATENMKTIREKMMCLGMVHINAGNSFHGKAELGRSLAITKWMDGITGSSFKLPWSSCRYGASCDDVSLEVCQIIGSFREFVASKAIVYRQRHGKKIQKCSEIELAPRGLLRIRKSLRISGFCWQPNPKSGDDWGGSYGKCSGHNEVVMFYSRPFVPQEVLNTHVCSRQSPAPGNTGFDGCLEFLIAQCRWFHRPMTIWDSDHFHFITQEGQHFMFEKRELLEWPLPRLRVFMLNLRYLTIECDGVSPPSILLFKIDWLIGFATGANRFSRLSGDGSLKCQRLICRYLLRGSVNDWLKASL